MPSCRFSLNLSSQDYQAYYRGQASTIVALSDTGARIAFPASQLQRFVTRDGVKGRFEIVYSEENRFIRLIRLN